MNTNIRTLLSRLAADSECDRPRPERLPNWKLRWDFPDPLELAELLRPRMAARPLFAAALLLTTAASALGSVHYVDMNSTNAASPYTNWATAATNIQVAVDAAVAGDEVVVTNGTYAGGVSINKPLVVRSVTGPQFTAIAGGGPCVSLASNASLSGFTVTGGFAGCGGFGGGVFCQSSNAVVSNCVITGNTVYTDDCAAQAFGGGAYGGMLNNCILANNSVSCYDYGDFGDETAAGGGAACCTLNNCTLSGNSASIINLYNYYGTDFAYGGAAAYCTLNNCALSSNSVAASSDYGAHSVASGGGANNCTLNNCTLIGNSYDGAARCTLNNCTLTSNSAGATVCALTNCIAYFNTEANYDSSCTFDHCCTTPLPTDGVGNISSDPQLASASHLSAISPCISKGNYAAASGVDIDGEPWANPPSIGCDEYHAGAVIGPLTVSLTATYRSVPVGFVLTGSTVQFTALIDGRTTASVWDFRDGTTVTNQPYTSHAWATPGDYVVALWAFNESQPGGVSATVTVHVVTPANHNYVAADIANPVRPYTSWATAATNIQDAVDFAAPGALVEVTNGIYATGVRNGSRVAVDKPLTLRSVNGPLVTVINGGQSIQCVSLANGASLSGFTLTKGVAYSGGGAYGGTLSNCVLTGNSASGLYGGGGGAYSSTLNNCTLSGNSGNTYGGGASECRLNNCTLSGNSAFSGGGAYSSALNNCTLTGNSATGYSYSYTYYYRPPGGCQGSGDDCGYPITVYVYVPGQGGGACSSTLNNCTLSGNSADSGGGAYYGTLNNSIAYFNTATNGANYDPHYSTLNYCCTTPQPNNGVGNIASAPLSADTNGWANLRLQSNSPCINAGNNSYLTNSYFTNSFDLDGNPRIAGGTVDIGAYEFQSPGSIISYAWLQQFGLPTDGSADTVDPDGDGVDDYHEWLAGTDPTNPLSSPAQLTISPSEVPPSGIILSWSTNAVGFTLQSATNLLPPVTWVTNFPTPVVVNGQNTVTNPHTGAQQFYRLIH